MRIEDVIREKKWDAFCDVKYIMKDREYEDHGTCFVKDGSFVFFGREDIIVCVECSDMCVLIGPLEEIERVEVVQLTPRDKRRDYL